MNSEGLSQILKKILKIKNDKMKTDDLKWNKVKEVNINKKETNKAIKEGVNKRNMYYDVDNTKINNKNNNHKFLTNKK